MCSAQQLPLNVWPYQADLYFLSWYKLIPNELQELPTLRMHVTERISLVLTNRQRLCNNDNVEGTLHAGVGPCIDVKYHGWAGPPC